MVTAIILAGGVGSRVGALDSERDSEPQTHER